MLIRYGFFYLFTFFCAPFPKYVYGYSNQTKHFMRGQQTQLIPVWIVGATAECESVWDGGGRGEGGSDGGGRGEGQWSRGPARVHASSDSGKSHIRKPAHFFVALDFRGDMFLPKSKVTTIFKINIKQILLWMLCRLAVISVVM